MGELPTGPAGGGSGRRLDSWKEIARYLRRDIKSAQRWEREEGLPVHRHRHGVRSSVYAFEGEIEAWRGQRQVAAPPLSQSRGRSTPVLVGRDRELGRLNAAWTRARAGERQIIFLSGELGIGKTALAETFLAGLDSSVWMAEGRCSDQFGPGEPYLPLIEALSGLAAEAHRQTVEEVLERNAPSWTDLLLRRRQSRSARSVAGSVRERSGRELRDAIEALAAVNPLVLLIEDLHWSDLATVELLAHLARNRERAPLMLIGTLRRSTVMERRPELWRSVRECCAHFQSQEMPLAFLDPEAVEQYLSLRGPWRDLSAAGRWFHEHTEGNALFLVHLLQHLIERGDVVERDGVWTLDAVTQPLTMVPLTLKALIQAQYRGLDEKAQRALDVASVVGNTFAVACVSHVLGHERHDVEAVLHRVARHGDFIEERAPVEWPDGSFSSAYGFTHAFCRMALYDQLAAGARAAFHARVGDRLQQAYGASSPQIATELAMHFERARKFPAAILQYRDAADHALRLGALNDARACLRSALSLTAQLPAGDERDATELDLRLRKCAVLVHAHALVHPTVQEAVQAALTLAGRLPASQDSTTALLWLTRIKFMSGDTREALSLGEQALARARVDGHGLANALYVQAQRHLRAGHFAACEALAREALDVPSDGSRSSSGFDLQQATLCALAWRCWFGGRYEESLDFMNRSLVRSAMVDPIVAALGQGRLAALLEYMGFADRSLVVAESAAATGLRCGLGAIQHWNEASLGWLLARRKDPQGVDRLRAAIGAINDSGMRIWLPWLQAWLVEAELTFGRAVTALSVADEALEMSRTMGILSFDAELLRLRAEALACLDRLDESEQALREGVDIAVQQDARTWQLRCALALARLHERTGRREQIGALIEPVCAAFTERLAPTELNEARALLGAVQH